jgi:riboflavin synthase
VFDLNIVPHTLQETVMNDYQAGHPVNLEVDIIARYLERLLSGDPAKMAESGVVSSMITEEFLAKHGFIK